MDEFEKELKESFLEESCSLLEDTEQAFLALENNQQDKQLLDKIFRLAHNLKGTSRAVGFGDVAEFTHEMENLILKVKEGILPINGAIVSLLLECNDYVTAMINTLRMEMDSHFDSSEIIAKIKVALEGGLSSDAAPAEAPIEESTPEEIVPEEILAGQEGTFEDITPQEVAVEESIPEVVGEINKHEEVEFFKGKEELNNVQQIPAKKPTSPENAAAPAAAKTQSSEEESIRVSLSRVEKLNNAVGELVILQTVLDQRRYIGIKDELANKSISQLSKLSKEIQEISMSLRMVPLKSTLQKMTRIVRDTSKLLGKTVQLDLIGEDTEVDKAVLEHLSDPLVHMVRNAVDHGLEMPQDRIKNGKNETGNITLKAFHEGNNLVIEIKDDGAGIDPQRIRKKAIEKGIISADKQLSEEELINFIFHPSFSTKDQVTEVSGRGVGMDVVKTNIEKLSGEVKVKTEVGNGSVFKVVLPLTMAIIDAMITKVGDDRYIIPLGQIHESLKPPVGSIGFITGVGTCMNLRGMVLPLLKISDALKRGDSKKDVHDQIAIIVNSEEKSFAVLVDDIINQQQVVIKKLGPEIKDQNGFIGSSILGDGKPAFILDLENLFKISTSSRSKQSLQLRRNAAAAA